MEIPVAVAGWSNQAETFLTLIDAYKTKEMFCDCTLACKEKFFRAHKMILAMCSELFEKIFLTTQDKNPVVILHEIEAWQIECLLNYMYKGETRVSDSKFPALCKVATYLQIKGFDKLEMYRQAVKAAKQKDKFIKVSSTDPSWKNSYPSKYETESSPEFMKDTQSATQSVFVEKSRNFPRSSLRESVSRDSVYSASQSSPITEEVVHHKANMSQPPHIPDPGKYYKNKPPTSESYETSSFSLNLNHNSDHSSSSSRPNFQSKFGSERNSPSSAEFKDAKLYWQSRYQSEMNISYPTEPRKDDDHLKNYSHHSTKHRDYLHPPLSRRSHENQHLIQGQHQNTPEESWRSHEEQFSPNHFQFKASSIPSTCRDQVDNRPSPTKSSIASHGPPVLASEHFTTQENNVPYIKQEVSDSRVDDQTVSADLLNSHRRIREKEFHYSPCSSSNYSHREDECSPNTSEENHDRIHYKYKYSNIRREANPNFSYPADQQPKKQKSGILRALPPLLKIVCDETPSSGNEGECVKEEMAETGDVKFSQNDPLLEKIPTNKRKRVRGPKSWEFLLRLLRSPSGNPSLIKWEDEEEGVFRLIKPEVIAQRWGQRTGKHDHDVLSYESFSRGLRYHYATGALCAVSEKSFVYQFGPKAQKALKSPIHSNTLSDFRKECKVEVTVDTYSDEKQYGRKSPNLSEKLGTKKIH